jgi:pimeloyl-ACP methyl ester carboxylesterase
MPNLTANGAQLYYEDEGDGRPLFFCTAGGTSARVWNAQLREFVHDHRVVTVDWRGCGRSDRPATDTTIAGVVSDLLTVIDKLGLEAPIVVGSSIGAVYAAELALRYPDRVAQVVSVDSPGYWPATGMLDKVHSLRAALLADRAGTLADWVPNWYAPGTSTALIDWTVRQILESGVYIDELFTECTEYDPRPELPVLRVPIHYLHGALDAEIPLEVPSGCAALTPGAGFTVIDGAGHMPQQEKPAEFNAVLRAIIA